MKLLKPTWVSHEGRAIFSIDIHPDGSRFATGGQGDDSGQVVIWNMAPVRNAKDEMDEKVPKMLCHMTNHLACVNCVRWSYSGRYLASGGDDKLVMIWQISRYSAPSKVFGSANQEDNVEQWRPVCTLRGHSGDVLDLAWSPEDIWLASCSVDNSIVIWNACKFPEQVAVLQGHKGLVKGVTWDPVGKYVASQGDDKSLRIWRTRDWHLEATVTKPFEECGGTTHVLRLNWSPDGHYIVSAHAMNNSGPTAQIIERDGWRSTLDFVGHRKAVTVVRFNPSILSKKMKKNSEKPLQYSCCAIGSKDRSVSIWLTALKRPLVVTHDLFTSSVMDISWSSNALELLCCSSDGTVAFLKLDESEMGCPLSQIEIRDLLERVYGRSLPLSVASKPGAQIIESAAMLKLQQEQQQEKEEKKSDISAACPSTPSKPLLINGDSSSTPYKPRDKQIETKTPDGRRRITPIFLAPQIDTGPFSDVPQPFQGNKNIEFTTSTEQSKIVVEKHDKVAMPDPMALGAVAEGTPPTVGDVQTSMPKAASSLFQPLAPCGDEDKAGGGTPKAKAKSSKDDDKDKSTPQKDRLDKGKDKQRLTLGKRKKEEKRYGKVGRPRKVDVLAREAAEKGTSITSSPATPSIGSQAGESGPRSITVTELLLPAPSIEKTAHLQVSQALQLVVENDMVTGAGTLHKLRCLEEGKLAWEQILKSRINAFDASSTCVCVACENGTVSVFNANGRRLLPCLALNSRAAILHCKGHYVMAVSQRGSINVWNVKISTCTVRNEQLTDIMTADNKIHKTMLTADGVPIITLDSKLCYSFSPSISSWVLVSDKNSTLQMCSNHHTCVPQEAAPRGPLSSVIGSTQRPGQQAGKLYQAPRPLQLPATISHLESQVALSLALQAAPDYKFWLLTYTRYLAQEGFEERLRDVCDDLLGPVLGSRRSESGWTDTVLGMKKRDLLGDVLPVMGTNLQLQRLYTEYQEQLDYIKKML